jgi:hypothetical protein
MDKDFEKEMREDPELVGLIDDIKADMQKETFDNIFSSLKMLAFTMGIIALGFLCHIVLSH